MSGQLTPPTRSSMGWGGHLFTEMLLLRKPRTQSALNCVHSVGVHLCAFPGQTPQLLIGASVLCRMGTTLPWGGLGGRLDVRVPSPHRLTSMLGSWGPSPINPTSPSRSPGGRGAGWSVAPPCPSHPLPQWAGRRLGSCPTPSLPAAPPVGGAQAGQLPHPVPPSHSPGGQAVAGQSGTALPPSASPGHSTWQGPGPYQDHVASGDVHVGLHGLL